MIFFKVANLEKYQHYTDRCPPWIKLHRSIFDDYEFSCLTDSSKLQLMLIWLLASQMDNKLPKDEAWIKRKIGVSTPVNLKPLFDNGFLKHEGGDSKLLASCSNDTHPHGGTETETYKPTETEKHIACEKEFEEDWALYPRKAGNKKKAFACYQKTVGSNLEGNRPKFQTKMREYVASVDDHGYLYYGETFFRNWEGLEVSNIRPIKQESFDEKHEREMAEMRERLSANRN